MENRKIELINPFVINVAPMERLLLVNFEKNPKKRKPFGLLAPMGDAAENPSALPLILLHDFYFVRKKATELEISIDNKVHQPDGLPMPMDGANMFFSRYSPRPLIARFNPAFDGEIIPLHLSPGQERASCSDYDIDIQWKNQQPGIKRIIRKNEIYPLTLDFPKAFPSIQALESTRPYEGTFIITGDPTTRSFSMDSSWKRI